MTQTLFAADCGIATSTMGDYLRGATMPTLRDAFEIQDLTCGEVQARAWLFNLES